MSDGMFRLSDQVAVITGGSRGIGLAIARAYCRAGAKVVIAGRRPENLEAAVRELADQGDQATPIPCHMGEMDQVRDLAAKTVEIHGTIDILVNNAAINPFFGFVLDADEKVWDKIMDVNLKGCFFLAQEAARVMMKKGGGKIINIASTAGHRPSPMQSLYSISKAGIIAMTKSLAKELAPHQIRVNAIAPGLTNTKFSAPLINTKEILDFVLQSVPLKRYAEPEEIVGAALYLASDASSYVTGTVLDVDGGSMA